MITNKALVREVQIEVTSRCNADCPFCINRASFAAEGRHAIQLSGTELHAVLEWLARCGIDRIRLTGGEPMLRRDIAELIIYAKSLGFTVIVNTNGMSVPRYAEVLRSYADVVLISMLSPHSEKTNMLMRSRDAHRNKMAALAALRGYNGLWMSTVMRDGTADEIEQLAWLGASFGVQRWILLRPEPHGGDMEEYEQSVDGIRAVLDVLSDKWDNLPLRPAIGNSIPICTYRDSDFVMRLLNEGEGGIVSEGRSKLVIDPSGNVLVHYGVANPVGRVLDDMADMLEHPIAQAFRGNWLPAECHGCRYAASCRGGSRLAAARESGTYWARDPWMIGAVI
jgi:radical SAM protein with 4Fe4S-binding SPASM domain